MIHPGVKTYLRQLKQEAEARGIPLPDHVTQTRYEASARAFDLDMRRILARIEQVAAASVRWSIPSNPDANEVA